MEAEYEESCRRCFCAFEEYSDRRIRDLFDLVVGTSTGGLIALAATSKQEITANEILDLYLKHAKQIFDSPRSRYLRPFWGPKYSGEGLRVLGEDLFGDGRLSESKVPTAVTAYDIAERRPYVLKSWRAKESPKRDCLLPLVSRKKCTNPCSCETIVCTIPVASAAWCDRQA